MNNIVVALLTVMGMGPVTSLRGYAVQGRPESEGAMVRAFDRDVYVHNANYDEKKIAPYTLGD